MQTMTEVELYAGPNDGEIRALSTEHDRLLYGFFWPTVVRDDGSEVTPTGAHVYVRTDKGRRGRRLYSYSGIEWSVRP